MKIPSKNGDVGSTTKVWDMDVVARHKMAGTIDRIARHIVKIAPIIVLHQRMMLEKGKGLGNFIWSF